MFSFILINYVCSQSSIYHNIHEPRKIYEYIEGFIKYQYVAIVYQNNSYTIVYTNTENDNTCSAMFNEFIDTLKFK